MHRVKTWNIMTFTAGYSEDKMMRFAEQYDLIAVGYKRSTYNTQVFFHERSRLPERYGYYRLPVPPPECWQH